ncbi:hypothetical protein O1611_g788 [Lasiodiplodia mahajangana]|uniref:Uncharacterized protein n=1 Tax=Lasiodiplodia mahajangana TaxID=1108764 RepID=A0ACC2K042_9PEZI|nr:hypothetical protein O1611_g788 [Lasiodiplodia mahajangana]
MGHIGLCIGIEIELLVELKNPLPRRGHHGRGTSDNSAVYYALQRWLVQTGVQAVVKTDGNMSSDTSRWTIQGDYSLSEKKNCYGIELASRIFHTNEDWDEEVGHVWSVLTRRFEIKSDESCGTHVHISVQDGEDAKHSPTIYDLDQLRRISKSVVIYEDAVTQLVPEDRKSCHYCTSNVRVPNTLLNDKYTLQLDHATSEIFEWINGFKEEPTVMSNMSPVSRHAPQHEEAPGFGGRYVSWNFTSLSKQGTIEFRRAPKSVSKEDTWAWAGFALCFVANAIRCESPENLNWQPASLSELKRAIMKGGTQVNLPTSLTEILKDLYST